ncbi:septum formation protein Maf [Verrucomicrobiaceae bacterium N1E253]|uniref:dTTP/UTP pyrophosphatase n=1 Tax=Oceaniferula marina TaxID=2748318 RepID=A0A851GI49_9BACT|nr:Maf family protein [Oceaniferula marina]NWK54807.1 septum formation protein Maf [Oceaniferula marina]
MGLDRLILASGSPRRRELLSAAGLDFDVLVSPAEELHDASIPLPVLCEGNAKLKALAVAKDFPEAVVLGADTLVYIDQMPLGKPDDEAHARKMLQQLSGRTSKVCTGVCLARGGESHCFHEITEVVFKPLSLTIIDDYLSKVHVLDKAGAYAVQEHGDLIIEQLKGDYDNVVGLPVQRVLQELRRF